jgi:integrase
MPNRWSGTRRSEARHTFRSSKCERSSTAEIFYVAWPYLTGTRISEHLALQWRDIEWEEGVIRIRRTQEKKTGSLVECTKTEAGTRAIPMSATLRRMLAECKYRCPSRERAFPAPNDGTLLYSNYLRRIWRPALKRRGLPPVSIHSARASFISMLQASGARRIDAADLSPT